MDALALRNEAWRGADCITSLVTGGRGLDQLDHLAFHVSHAAALGSSRGCARPAANEGVVLDAVAVNSAT